MSALQTPRGKEALKIVWDAFSQQENPQDIVPQIFKRLTGEGFTREEVNDFFTAYNSHSTLEEALGAVGPTQEDHVNTPSELAEKQAPEQQPSDARQPLGFRALAYNALQKRQARTLPIVVGDKNPCIKWKDTEIDVLPLDEWVMFAPEWIEKLAMQFPNANCCEIAKDAERCFLDEDTNKFRVGFEKWAGIPFPRTFTTESQPGHRQSHWLQTDKTRALGNKGQDRFPVTEDAPGGILSFRQNNLYVLSEGSQHKNGVTYYDVCDDSPAIPMPDKLVEYLEHLIAQRAEETKKNAKSSGDTAPRNEQGLVPHGSIHGFLLTQAGRLRQMGLGQDAIEVALLELAHANCEPPIDDSLVVKMAGSICNFAAGDPRFGSLIVGANAPGAAATQSAAPTTPAAQSEMVIRRMSSYAKRKISWLWKDRVPFGTITTIAGDPDQGKSLVSLYIAACITRGIPMFGENESSAKGDVLLLSAEDDPESTLGPRLEAASADMDRVLLIDSVIVKDGAGATKDERLAQLDTDLQQIKLALDGNPNIRLIIIDPISSFLGSTPMWKEQDVRRVLNPLLKECQTRKLAVILVAHFNKNSETRSAMDRVGGAKALVGLGRAAWTCVREPKKEQQPGESMPIEDLERRLFLKLKGNLTPSSIGGLVYTIKTKPIEVQNDEGGKEMVDTPLIVWTGKTDSTAQDVVIDGKPGNSRDAQIDAGVTWLRSFLEKTGGSAWSDDVIEAGKLRGYGERTLQRHLGRLKAEVFRVGKHTQWVLPGAQLQPESSEPTSKITRPGKRPPKTVDINTPEPETVKAA